MENGSAETTAPRSRQFSTFYVADRLYGIDVMKVQEITNALPITHVPLAPSYVYGLINLRGQISTAIGLRELFGLKGDHKSEQMNVVCRIDDTLLSLQVDRIGEVLELEQKFFEEAPDTIPEDIRTFMSGVYKIEKSLLSIIEIDRVARVLGLSRSPLEFDRALGGLSGDLHLVNNI